MKRLLQIKGVDEGLVAKLKLKALIEGVTLRELVIEVLGSKVSHMGPMGVRRRAAKGTRA